MQSRALEIRKYRFGPFEIDLHTGELWKDGCRVKIQDKPFQVLRFLLERCIPLKLKAPPLNARDGMVAIEELQLACESITLKGAAGA